MRETGREKEGDEIDRKREKEIGRERESVRENTWLVMVLCDVCMKSFECRFTKFLGFRDKYEPHGIMQLPTADIIVINKV